MAQVRKEALAGVLAEVLVEVVEEEVVETPVEACVGMQAEASAEMLAVTSLWALFAASAAIAGASALVASRAPSCCVGS